MFGNLLTTSIMEMSFGFSMKGKNIFLKVGPKKNRLDLCLYEMTNKGKTYVWKGDSDHYPVEAFLKAKIWNGKSFWDIEQDIEWVDD